MQTFLRNAQVPALQARVITALTQSINTFKAFAVAGTPAATGGTRGRIYGRVYGTGVNLYGIVASPDSYYPAIEYGRRAGARMPPDEPIRNWVRFRGIEYDYVWPIRAAIARKGIRPKRAFQNAFIRGLPAVYKFWTSAFSSHWA